jgi:hypothetical protein
MPNILPSGMDLVSRMLTYLGPVAFVAFFFTMGIIMVLLILGPKYLVALMVITALGYLVIFCLERLAHSIAMSWRRKRRPRAILVLNFPIRPDST